MKISKKTQKDLKTINGLSNKMILLFAGFMFSFFSIQALSSNEMNSNALATTSNYGNSFIFIESNIEFSIFPDGQFDFNILGNRANLNVSINTGNVNVSFNSGYNYNGYVQYDEYGAIVQIENIPIYYDDYGRVIQAGNVNVFYNNFGRIARVGSLNVFYNNYNQFTYTTGYINLYNRGYIFRPWHRYYRVPRPNYCVVYNRPYRTHYRPVRYRYVRPFINNARPRTAIASRRGHDIQRNRNYATVNRSSKNRTAAINNSRNTTRSVANNHYKQPNKSRAYKSNKKTTVNNNRKRTNTYTQNKKRTQEHVAKNPNQKNTRISNRTLDKNRNSQVARVSANNQKQVRQSTASRSKANKTTQRTTAQNQSRSSNNKARSSSRRI
ncbi:hypothetical protein [Tamlana sp. I1]|uniref:hypothetical protein n=1 Tax=Tamlana sp. I1 TaxID=2762061 RepID=UPI0018903587|nr:hypothetical protein [Tamlana sp. I1]